MKGKRLRMYFTICGLTGGRKSRIRCGWLPCIMAVTALCFLGCGDPPGEAWLTEKLTAEFTKQDVDEIKTFDDYRQLEERLFAQLKKKVYARTGTGPEFRITRYSAGSAADPQRREPNWNRGYELAADSPAGGVLLLHGMSDSPYSLRALGEALNRRGYWVVGLRLPGHGTAPSGLKRVTWEDMAAAVRLGMSHLASKVGGKPVHMVGYSTGAPLALGFSLDALEGKSVPQPASLVLVSPAIGIHPAAGLARFKDWLSILPGLGHFAWLSIEPEFDPYKYNSFATNAGNQVHRVTRTVAGRIKSWAGKGRLEDFSPTIVFKSTVDATVSTTAVVDKLLNPLGPHGHELVLFDINRLAAKTELLVSDPAPLTQRLMAEKTLPFTVTLVANENKDSRQVLAHHKAPFSAATTGTRRLDLAWPAGVISLSHVALPFPPDDPLYGRKPPETQDSIYLGQMAIKGERGLLRIPYDWLMRLRHNPFFSFLENRTLAWIQSASGRKTE